MNQVSADDRLEPVLESVRKAWSAASQSDSFVAWTKTNKPRDDEYIVLNNTFLHRTDVKTKKSRKYLVGKWQAGSVSTSPDVMTLGPVSKGQNIDFARIRNPANVTDLRSQASAELQGLGSLLFVLLGKATARTPPILDVDLGSVSRICWDEESEAPLVVKNETVTVKEVEDEAGLWDTFVTTTGESYSTQDRLNFSHALDRLQTIRSVTLRIPESKSDLKDGLLDRVLKALSTQYSEYCSLLRKWTKSTSTTNKRRLFHDILRIAYNFSADASVLLSLIASICDLKPIVLWATLDKHLALSDAIQDLPWLRSRDKASLRSYRNMIGNERNRAFHDLLPFDRAFHLQIPGERIGDLELRIFGEYRSDTNMIAFADKELADVLLSFTRARHRPTPSDFWAKNEIVLARLVALVAATNDTLKLLWAP